MKTEKSTVCSIYIPEFRESSPSAQLCVQLRNRYLNWFSSVVLKTSRYRAPGPVIEIGSRSDSSADKNGRPSKTTFSNSSSESQTQPVFSSMETKSTSSIAEGQSKEFLEIVPPPKSNLLQYRRSNSDNLTRQLKMARDEEASLSSGSDLFIYAGEADRAFQTAGETVLPPYNHSKYGILLVDIPRNLSNTAQQVVDFSQNLCALTWFDILLSHISNWRINRDFKWEWATRVASYDEIWVPSKFCQKIMAEYWRQYGKVVYSPLTESPTVFNGNQRTQKQKRIICCVNRRNHPEVILQGFTKLYNNVQQLAEEGWTLVFALELFDSLDRTESEAFISQMNKSLAEIKRQTTVNLHVESVPVSTLQDRLDLFKESAFFLDATGFGDDWKQNPEFLPGFHLGAADAMSVGAIPIIYCAGSASEIIIHGQSGYLWHKPEEMWASFLGLVQDPELRADISHLCTVRAQMFSEDMWDRRTFLRQFPYKKGEE